MSKSIYCVGNKIGEGMVIEQGKKDNGNIHAKRINIVSIKMVREGSML